MTDEEAIREIYTHMPRLKSAKAVAQHLVEKCKKCGAFMDDTTVVLVVLRPWWEETAEAEL